MQSVHILAGTFVSPSHGNGSSIVLTVAATISLIWYLTVALVCSIGNIQLWRYYSSPRPAQKFNAADVTIIRPCKGLEPRLYECLASTFRQDYPQDKLHVRFCISNREDPAYPILQTLVQDFPDFDAQILVEEDDELLRTGAVKLGPNPKIRNMSRAYREARGDTVWIMDCNIWMATGTCARMVAKLEGVGERRRYKCVHHLPIVVDIERATVGIDTASATGRAEVRTTSSASHATMSQTSSRTAYAIGGGRMEELFMSSAHAKFYTAINTVLIAPCMVGKSTMFRRSHLNSLTDGTGIDFFSENICEDQLIGDALWKKDVPEEAEQGEKLGKHALCFGDLAIQPMANMSVGEYWSRRVRWLRVRKFTVTLATFVEPGTECFVWSLYGAFAVTTLPWFHTALGFSQTWTVFAVVWFLGTSIWCAIDRRLYIMLHSCQSIEADEHTPFFAQPRSGASRRSFGKWFLAWLGREALALPIWTWAFYGGTTVRWRGRRFRVGMDMKVHEVKDVHGKQA